MSSAYRNTRINTKTDTDTNNVNDDENNTRPSDDTGPFGVDFGDISSASGLRSGVFSSSSMSMSSSTSKLSDEDEFKTPLNRRSLFRSDISLGGGGLGSKTRGSAVKRDSLVAELERDPQLSSSKRQHRHALLSSTLSSNTLSRQLLAAESHARSLEAQLAKQRSDMARLEEERVWLAAREKEEREERERSEGDWKEERVKRVREVADLRERVREAREEVEDVKEERERAEREARKWEKEAARFKEEMEGVRREKDAVRAQMELLKAEVESERKVETGGNGKVDEEDEKRKKDEETRVIRDELKRQTTYLRKLESANARMNAELVVLRDRKQSVDVLKEEQRALQGRLDRATEELATLRREKENWSNTPTTSIPDNTMSELAELTSLRLAHTQLLDQHGASSAQLSALHSELSSSRSQTSELQNEVVGLREEVASLKDTLKRRDARADLVQREVVFLKEMLGSYEGEEKMVSEEGKEQKGNEENEERRIEIMQGLLEEYKQANVNLCNELDRLLTNKEGASVIDELKAENESLKHDITLHTHTISTHLNAIDELEQRLFELSGEIAGGRHVPPNTRILSLANNPEQEWFDMRREEVDRVRAENAALMKRLHELEGEGKSGTNSEHGTDLVPRESWELVNREKKDMEEVVKQKEKRLLRLQQVFASKSAEFRSAIASILGVKLAFYPNGQVRVTSVYDLNASFVFGPLSGRGSETSTTQSQQNDMRMQLIAQSTEGGPQDLPSMTQYWIESQQCIPGFLASVTLECWERYGRG